MTYKWRASFSFDYPLLDIPIDIGNIRLYPSPPELDLEPHAIHYYEFETSSIGMNDQQEVRKKYLDRLEKLTELSVLAPYYTEVSFHSIVLLDNDNQDGFPQNGTNFYFGGKPCVPSKSPKEFREDLKRSAQTYIDIQELRKEIQDPISRALRWIYRSNDYRISSDDKLIYRWIAFNSLYNLFNSLENKEIGERQSVRAFEQYFRSLICVIKDGTQQLASSGLQLSKGQDRNVSENLRQAIANNSNLITLHSLECVYAARCSLFHGDEKPLLYVSNTAMSASADYLASYLKNVIPKFVSYCKQHSTTDNCD